MNGATLARAAGALLVMLLTSGAALADGPADPITPPAGSAQPPARIPDEPAPRAWLAQPQAPKSAPAPEPTHFPWRAATLVLVVGGIGGAAVVARRRRFNTGKRTSSSQLRVISSVRVGPKGLLVLAGVGDRALLLGVTDDSVRRIAWLPNDAAELTGSAPEAGRPAPPFGDFMRGLRASVDDAAKPGLGASPAETLAGESRDIVKWSKSAKAPTLSSLASARGEADLPSASSLEQQAAGIMKRKARRRV